MAKSTGQDSAPRADICTASVQDARPQQGKKGRRRPPVSDIPFEIRATWLICSLVYEHPFKADDIKMLLDLPVLWGGRKTMLLTLHARGLVTDEQVQRAFAEHPELRSA